MRTAGLWISLGCNVAGRWGDCETTLDRALVELEAHGLRAVARSRTYKTRPVGLLRQPAFFNAVVGLEGAMAPGVLLRLAKCLERRAGRKSVGPRGGPRPLDIDILDHGGRRIGRAGAVRIAGRILLPHPEIGRRGFVLVPLAEVSAGWRHPRLGVGAVTLLARNPGLRRGVEVLHRRQ